MIPGYCHARDIPFVAVAVTKIVHREVARCMGVVETVVGTVERVLVLNTAEGIVEL